MKADYTARMYKKIVSAMDLYFQTESNYNFQDSFEQTILMDNTKHNFLLEYQSLNLDLCTTSSNCLTFNATNFFNKQNTRNIYTLIESVYYTSGNILIFMPNII